MSAHVLLNLLNEKWKRDKMRGQKICKTLLVYRFYCMAFFHSQALRHMINQYIIYSSNKIISSLAYCSGTIFLAQAFLVLALNMLVQ